MLVFFLHSLFLTSCNGSGWIDCGLCFKAQRPCRRWQKRPAAHCTSNCPQHGKGLIPCVTSAFNLNHHCINVTYREVTVFLSRHCVLTGQAFPVQVIGLSSNGIDNWGHVSVGVILHEFFNALIFHFLSSFVQQKSLAIQRNLFARLLQNQCNLVHSFFSIASASFNINFFSQEA